MRLYDKPCIIISVPFLLSLFTTMTFTSIYANADGPSDAASRKMDHIAQLTIHQV